MVLEDADHSHLALLLWACVEATYHGGEHLVEEAADPVKTRKQEEDRVLIHFQGHPRNDLLLDSPSPHFLPLSAAPQTGGQAMNPWGIFQTQASVLCLIHTGLVEFSGDYKWVTQC